MEDTDLARARTGDRGAFDRLVAPHLVVVRSLVHRMVGHPDDAADLVQETLLRAYQNLAGFRGEAAFRTWLCSIATRAALDHLRTRRRWRFEAQLEGERVGSTSAEEVAQLREAFRSADFAYDFREHIAFCFTCVGRALDPEEHAALLLADVFDLPNRDGARILGVGESVFRHRLSAARQTMQEAFDGLCALVSKTGACHQCSVLRDAAPPDRRGPPVEAPGGASDSREERFRVRLQIVRDADLVGGRSARLHDALLRLMTRLGEAAQ